MTAAIEPAFAEMTFLFSDVEGSTRLLERFPKAQPIALVRHDELLTGAINRHHGSVLETVGDGFYTAFERADDALAAALEAQRLLRAEDWGEIGEIRVRMAIHTGEAERRGGNFYGPPLYRCARLLALAHGGQVLLSGASTVLVRQALRDGAQLRALGAYRLRDLVDPEEVYQLVHPDLLDEFPPLRSVDARPNNLPAELTAFVGRETDRATLTNLITSARLVTITGPGGVGKTRLALAAAREQLSAFEHGVFLVDLSGVDAPELLSATIGQTLRLREPAVGAWDEELRRELRDRSLLLILDNFEQIVAAGRLVADLLAACPRLKVIVTSRECLQVSGEHELPLQPLALLDPAAAADPAAAEANEAVALFVRRAQAVRPSFALTPQNAPAVVEICRRLDGLPLGIELAAARVKMLQPRELLAKLGSASDARTLAVLAGGRQDAAARHQTLRAAIDWSYQLLTAAEQRLFRRLAAFAGGWTFDAAETVCADDELDVADGLFSLMDKSLTRSIEGTEDETRYAMLGTIRQYALEQLRGTAEAEEIMARHAGYFADLAEAVEPRLTGAEQGPALRQLDLDYQNLQGALVWAAEHGDHELGLRIAGALWRFWVGTGRVAEGLEHVQRALLNADGSPASLRAKALSAGGSLAFQRGDLDLAVRLYEECLALRREVADALGVAGTLNNLGLIAWQRGDLDQAKALYEESLAAYRQRDHRYGMSLALSNLGILAAETGDLDRAREFYEESLGIRRELDDLQGQAIALQNLADLAVKRRDLGTARTLLEEALGLYRDLQSERGFAYVFDNLGSLALSGQQAERAARLFGAAEALRTSTGAAMLPAEASQREGEVTLAMESLGPDGYTRAFEAGRAMLLADAIDYALEEAAIEARPAGPAGFHIEIDRTRAEQQVAAITETDYFRDLQSRVATLRGSQGPAAAENGGPS
jgi:predicted ATPase/class 3 adenylate cyclase